MEIFGKNNEYKHETIWNAFKRQLINNPERIAIRTKTNHYTYNEISNMVDFYVNIIDKKVNLDNYENVRIIIHMRRSVYLASLLLAIKKLNMTYISIEWNAPVRLCQYIQKDSEAYIVITDNENKLENEIFGGIIININNYQICEGNNYQKDSSRGDEKCKLNRIHNIIYTSGTTGNPKGVIIRECGIIHIINNFIKLINFNSNDCILTITSTSFDTHAYDYYAAWFVGASILLTDVNDEKDGNILKELLSKVTVAQLTPSVWNLAIQSGWKGNMKMKASVGGEVLSEVVAKNILDRVEILYNCWGPTEVTIDGSCGQIIKEDYIHIGTPVSNTRIYFINGEIYVGGPGVSVGYLNLPNKLIKDNNYELLCKEYHNYDEHDIYHKLGNGWLYKTGDRGYLDNNNNIIFQGRQDNQVKIKGNRIELDNIKNVLEKITCFYPITNVALRVHEYIKDEKIIIAYLESSTLNINDLTIIKDELSKSVNSYEKPQKFIILDKFPLTTGGKLDIKNFPLDNHYDMSKLKQAKTELEKEVEFIIREILNQENYIGVDTNIFEMGAASLTITQIIKIINEKYQIKLSALDIYNSGTIETICKIIDEKSQNMENFPSSPDLPLYDNITCINYKIHKIVWPLWNILGFMIIGSIIVLPMAPIIWIHNYYEYPIALLLIPIFSMIWSFSISIIILLFKWILIGKYKEGIYNTASWFYYRHWLIDNMINYIVPITIGKFIGTPIWNIWLYCLGVNTYMANFINTSDINCYDLITFSKNVIINDMSCVRSGKLFSDPKNGTFFIIKPIIINSDSWLGHRSVVHGGTTINHGINPMNTIDVPNPHFDIDNYNNINNTISSYKVLFSGLIAIFNFWLLISTQLLAYFPVMYFIEWLLNKIHSVGPIDSRIFIILGFLILLPIYFEVFILLFADINSHDILYNLLHPQITTVLLGFIVSQILYYISISIITIFIYRVINIKIKPGLSISRFSFFYHLVLFSNELIKITSDLLSVFDGTFIISFWWKLLGANVYPTTMIFSGKSPFSNPKLISIGAYSECGIYSTFHTTTFFVDKCFFNDISVGNNCLIGVHSILLPGSVLPNNVKLSALSKLTQNIIIKPTTTSILNNQQFSLKSPDKFNTISFKFILLQLFYIIIAPLFITFVQTSQMYVSLLIITKISILLNNYTLLFVPLIFLIYVTTNIIILILLRWIITPDFNTGTIYNYLSTFSWYRILFVKFYIQISNIITILYGSPWYNFLLNSLGGHISPSSIIYSDLNIANSLCTIGDNSVLDRNSVLQAYIANDNNLYINTIIINSNVTISNHAVIFYNSSIDPNSYINSLSLVMPGQHLSTGNYYGIPVSYY